jgi:superfamily I DNA/RNA helicase
MLQVVAMIVITDEDIKQVEEKFGVIFDNESREFIKCMETKDIQACPGAGKTTSLVAKLDILAKYMPFRDGSGILVLSHTNVAVNEIKKRLEDNASKVLSYPNFVGTFQSFIDKYLAIPMYIKLFGKKPERIDDEVFEEVFFNKLSNNIRYGLMKKFSKGDNTDKEKEEKVKQFLKSFYIDNQEKLKKFNGKSFDFKNETTSTYLELKKIKKELLENYGFLTYNDCLFYAKEYLNKYPHISKVFQERFKYVFVDEAQDTKDDYFGILDKLFKDSKVVIQKIGDNNQAIYDANNNDYKGWQVDENNLIEIIHTKRLSSEISDVAKKVAPKPQELIGKKICIKPVIIIFEDDRIGEILDVFAELIKRHNLHTFSNPIFKAIGAVNNHSKYHAISDYFKNYKIDSTCFLAHKTLRDKLKNCAHNLKIKEYKNIVLDIVREYLNKEEFFEDRFTKRMIFKYLKEYDEKIFNDFEFLLFKVIDKLSKKECVLEEMQKLLDIFLKIKNKELNKELLERIIQKYKYKNTKTNKNIYKKDGIEITVSTIHKVKGETHTATLVLDTFHQTYNVFQFIKHLVGEGKIKDDKKKRVLYVAMTRATHLLCLAVHKKNKKQSISEKDIEILKQEGFEVIEL